MAQKVSLGKGLASLLPAAGAPLPSVSTPAAGASSAGPAAPMQQAEVPNKDRHPGITLAFIDEIKVNDYQPRHEFDERALEELAQSIRENGIIQPLVVRRTPEGYQLIAGERRLRASKRVGLKQVPVVIRKSTDREALELALIENIQRQNLNCIDESLAYRQLVEEFNLTQEEVAKRVGKERATVANYLRLLKLPEAVLDDLRRGILTFGHGKALLSVEDHDARLQARAIIVEKRLSVRDAEMLVDRLKRGLKPEDTAQSAVSPQPKDAVSQRFDQLSLEMARRWGTRVEFRGGAKKGKIIFHYQNAKDLERLIESLQTQS